jgi:putative Mn2+ efflux pump MntP
MTETKAMIEKFAENKYFIGVVMITMNIGARFLIDELTPEQKKVLNSQNFRRFIVFCAFFAATRDILAAITLTIIFILFVSEAFTDTEDTKNKKDKKITTTDIQNELNGLINKVKMMELDRGENEIEENETLNIQSNPTTIPTYN